MEMVSSVSIACRGVAKFSIALSGAGGVITTAVDTVSFTEFCKAFSDCAFRLPFCKRYC